MAGNTFVNTQKVAALAVAVLNRRAVLAPTLTRDYDSEFAGKVGDTITVRAEARTDAREHPGTGVIAYDDITEIPIPVALDKWVYNAAQITDKDNTLNVDSVNTRVLAPQLKAVARKLEGYAAAAMSSATYPDASQLVFGLADPWESVLTAGEILDNAEADPDQRFLAVGSAIRRSILSDPDLKRVDASGSSATLRQALVGNYAGFTVLYSPRLGADTAYAYHRSAFILATVAPQVPEGAVKGSTTAEDGFAVTWIRDYDPDTLSDRSVVQAFAGTAPVTDDGELLRAVAFTSASMS